MNADAAQVTRMNATISVSERIHAIERAITDSGVQVCLSFKADAEARGFWRSLNIANETVKVE